MAGGRRVHGRADEAFLQGDAEGRTAARRRGPDARGGKVIHYITYELPLFDGRRLRTRVWRPADNTTYGPSLWKAILRDRLEVTEDEFWA